MTLVTHSVTLLQQVERNWRKAVKRRGSVSAPPSPCFHSTVLVLTLAFVVIVFFPAAATSRSNDSHHIVQTAGSLSIQKAREFKSRKRTNAPKVA